MFTGIVEELGTVEALEDQGDAVRLSVRGPLVTEDAALGDSICVNGVCLTVAARDGELFTADVMRETLDKSSLGSLQPAAGQPGARRHPDDPPRRPRRPGPRRRHRHGPLAHAQRALGGRRGGVHPGADLDRYLVPKGSITVDGVSLTVVDVTPDSFTVSLIPETLARTTLGRRQPGETVNLEVDVIAKYVEKLVTR